MAVESFFLAVLLTITGGFLDAYTFCCRDQVFANAQTGNVVRVGIAIALGNPGDVIRYLIPIFAFAAGVLLALAVRDRTAAGQESLWRQRVLLLEIAVAAAVGIIPQGTLPNIVSNVLVSFLCALQAESFRKVVGRAFASTMCTGNLRSGTECLYQAIRKGDRGALSAAGRYFALIFIFVAGAALGVLISSWLGARAIFLTELPLVGALFFLFFTQEPRGRLVR